MAGCGTRTAVAGALGAVAYAVAAFAPTVVGASLRRAPNQPDLVAAALVLAYLVAGLPLPGAVAAALAARYRVALPAVAVGAGLLAWATNSPGTNEFGVPAETLFWPVTCAGLLGLGAIERAVRTRWGGFVASDG